MIRSIAAGRTQNVWTTPALALLLVVAATRVPAQSIPASLSDSAFKALIATVSESGGYFRSDNFLSNETGYQYVIPELKRLTEPADVYLGVGPEQNFTYLVALKPRMAIVFDIRRQNMIELLLYKALIEMSDNRADFLSRLFSRPRPAGLDTASSVQQLFESYLATPPDSVLRRQTLAGVADRLQNVHRLALSDADLSSLRYVFDAFFGGGPAINYSYPNGGFGGYGRGMPTYADLQTATDGDGQQRSYLASEANYRWLRDFEMRNLLVPVVGDFAGPHAIRSVAEYLKNRGAKVSAFYTSNVEQYLFQQGDEWARYYKNVETLPLDSTSTFIRSVGGGRAYFAPPTTYARVPAGGRLPSVLCSMQGLLKAFDEGRIKSYGDVIAMSR